MVLRPGVARHRAVRLVARIGDDDDRRVGRRRARDTQRVERPRAVECEHDRLGRQRVGRDLPERRHAGHQERVVIRDRPCLIVGQADQ